VTIIRVTVEVLQIHFAPRVWSEWKICGLLPFFTKPN